MSATATLDAAAQAAQVRALWGAAWARLCAERLDVEARLAELPKSGIVAKAEGSAGRWAARVLRGEADLVEFEGKLMEWEAAAADALTRQDDNRSRSVCGHCGDHNVATTVPGLTGARTCAKCSGECAPVPTNRLPTARKVEP